MKKAGLTIFVEGPTDEIIVRYILEAAGVSDSVTIKAHHGPQSVGAAIKDLNNCGTEKFLALIDADEMSTADSRELARSKLKHPNIPVYCAIPTIEAWLFADIDKARDEARSEQATRILERAPLPESIPYPKVLAGHVFRKAPPRQAYAFLQRIDVSKAVARSSSLRSFLAGVFENLGHPVVDETQQLTGSVNRDVFSTLLRELPSSTVVWKTIDGSTIDAARLAREVVEGTDLGKQYITEVLRIARDMIARKARP
ncbi:hypothetical protein DelCs14_3630 [Delftia sp. Cs1-4]|uniref:DUF4276 family protein n=1 Tax=Delftia sp. (strain Cs1-4) TaxID=742013 RepID=UPI00020E84B0|nr:DUF4276 family protein [Delftia sp. Cs1-4]AEF90622.1 hypothetical protein DelCs14_3630 [Delftia sp. Cs1-4]